MTRTWTDGRVLADGVDLHYRRSGGNGPVIVAVHGLTDDGPQRSAEFGARRWSSPETTTSA